MKNKILTFAIIFVIFLSVPTIKVFGSIVNGQTVDCDKTWNISFNHLVSVDETTAQNIRVIDRYSNPIKLTFDVNDSRKSILVKPQSGSYTRGESYTLVISKEFMALDNSKLKVDTKMEFNIKDVIPTDSTSGGYNYEGNFINDSFVSKDANYTYYVEKAQTNSYQGDLFISKGEYYLYKADKSGSKEVIYSGNVKNINIDDGFLYFNKDDDYYNQGIYKIKNDGSNGKTLVNGINYLAQKSGDYIYYTTSFNDICRVKSDGSVKEEIYITDIDTRYIDNINISGEWIYFSSYYDTSEELTDRCIYKMKLDGSELTKVGQVDITKMNVSGEWIYYINAEGLFKIKTDGSSNEKLVGGDLSSYSSLNVSLKSIYYTYDGSIYKIDLDGKNKVKIVSGSQFTTDKINLVGNHIYYYDDILGYTQLKSIIDENLSDLDNGDPEQPLINIIEKGDNYENLTVYDAKIGDVDGDLKNENIFIAGEKDGLDYSNSKLYIQDIESGRISDSTSVSSYFTDFKNSFVIQDFNGDKVKDIMLSLNQNTAAGSYDSFVYMFVNKQLSVLLDNKNKVLPKSDFIINPLINGIVKVDSNDTNKTFSIDISKDENESSYFIMRGGPFFKESYNEANETYELNMTEYISGNNIGDIIGEVTTTFKYNYISNSWDITDFNVTTSYDLIKTPTSPTETDGDNNGIYGNTNDNILNEGLVIEKDGWIYYVKKTYTVISESSLSYKSELYKRKVGSATDILLDSNVAGDISLISNTLYYDNGNISSINTDGTSKRVINYGSNIQMNVVGDWIYYIDSRDGSKIYKIKIDGTGKVKVNDDFSMQMSVEGDWIYYCSYYDNFNIYKIKIDGTNKTKVAETSASRSSIQDGWVYYYDKLDWEGIYKVKTDGSLRTKVSQGIYNNINISNGWIYYCNGEDYDTIYKMKTDGTNKTKISNDKAANIEIAGEWIYYENKDDNRCLYRIKTDGTMREEW